MRKTIIIVLQSAVTLVLLVWIFGNESLRSQLGMLIGRADMGWVGFGLLVAGVGNFLGGIRWWIYLRALGMPLPLWRTMELYFIGVLFNSVMPGMVGGDIVKIGYLIAEGYRKTAALMSVMLDRLSGLAALGFAVIIYPALRWHWFHEDLYVAGIMWFSLIAIGIMFLVVILSLVATQRGISRTLPQWLPFREGLDGMMRAYYVFISHRKATVIASLISVVMLLLYFLTFYAAARSVGVDMGFWDFSSIMPMVDVLVSAPISLGGLGIREKVFEKLMDALWGVASGKAIMISIGGWFFMNAWGLFGLALLPFYRGLLKKEGKIASRASVKES